MQKILNFYNNNKQIILVSFLIIVIIFTIFYWTAKITNSIKNNYESLAKITYERLETATNVIAKMKQYETTQNKENEGLLSFTQQIAGNLGIANKLANVQPISSDTKVEHISLRLENLYYDEFVNFIQKIESYNNLRIKSVSFTRRYDNPNMIDTVIEIIKS